MMDVVECYLGELVKRCIVQVQLEENEYGLNIRDLCLSKAKTEDFFSTFDFQHENGSELVESSSSFTNKTQRSMMYEHFKKYYKYIESII